MIIHKSVTGFALLSHASCRGHAFFADMRGVREFEEKFETLGPLMFGLADGQSEAPKIMAKKVITDASAAIVATLVGKPGPECSASARSE